MSRILVPTNTLVGRKVLALTMLLAQARADASRLKEIIDAITGGGVSASALEAVPGEAQVPATSGQAVYDAVVSYKVTLDSLAQTLAKFDQG